MVHGRNIKNWDWSSFFHKRKLRLGFLMRVSGWRKPTVLYCYACAYSFLALSFCTGLLTWRNQPVKNRNLSRLIANLSRQYWSSERECSCVEFVFFLPGCRWNILWWPDWNHPLTPPLHAPVVLFSASWVDSFLTIVTPYPSTVGQLGRLFEKENWKSANALTLQFALVS